MVLKLNYDGFANKSIATTWNHFFVILSEEMFLNSTWMAEDKKKKWERGKFHRNSIFFEHQTDISYFLFDSIDKKKIPQNWLEDVNMLNELHFLGRK